MCRSSPGNGCHALQRLMNHALGGGLHGLSLCWRRARLLCWVVLYVLTSGLPFRSSVLAPGLPLCLVCELCRLTVVWVGCMCFPSLMFLAGARRLELSPCGTLTVAWMMCGV